MSINIELKDSSDSFSYVISDFIFLLSALTTIIYKLSVYINVKVALFHTCEIFHRATGVDRQSMHDEPIPKHKLINTNIDTHTAAVYFLHGPLPFKRVSSDCVGGKG